MFKRNSIFIPSIVMVMGFMAMLLLTNDVERKQREPKIETGYAIEVLTLKPNTSNIQYADNVGLWFGRIGHSIGLGTGCELYNIVDETKAVQIKLCELERTSATMLDVMAYDESKKMWLTKVEDRLIVEPRKE